MQKHFLLILILFATVQVSAQISKNDFILSFSGNYHKSNDEIGVTTNNVFTETKQLSMGAALEYFISDKTAIGFGLGYLSRNEFRKSSMTLVENYQVEEMDLDAKMFFPTFHVARYIPLVNNLYLTPLFGVGYGQMKSEYSSESAYVLRMNNGVFNLEDGYPGSGFFSSNDSSDDDYLMVDLIPQLNYFFSNGFGLSLGLGGIHYAMINGDSDNSQWQVSFDPSYWTFGFKMKL